MSTVAPSQANQVDDEIVRKILGYINDIRPMPTSVSRVLTALDNQNSDAEIISEFLGLDQALTANVLSVANSVILGYGPSCSNLNDAVMRLGFKRLRTIVLGVGVSNTFDSSLPTYGLMTGDLWNHSIATAVAAQWLARTFSMPNPEDIYVAGLLHDIGKLVLDRFARVYFPNLDRTAREFNCPFFQIEDRVFGINHAVVGGALARKWNFPDVLANPIEDHHSPGQAKGNKRIAAIINIANAFNPIDSVTLQRLGKRTYDPSALDLLKLTEKDLFRLNDEMNRYFKPQING